MIREEEEVARERTVGLTVLHILTLVVKNDHDVLNIFVRVKHLHLSTQRRPHPDSRDDPERTPLHLRLFLLRLNLVAHLLSHRRREIGGKVLLAGTAGRRRRSVELGNLVLNSLAKGLVKLDGAGGRKGLVEGGRGGSEFGLLQHERR